MGNYIKWKNYLVFIIIIKNYKDKRGWYSYRVKLVKLEKEGSMNIYGF